MSSKGKTIGYWVATALVALVMAGGGASRTSSSRRT